MTEAAANSLEGLRLMAVQMTVAERAGLHFPALMTALALPDICGALGSENGRASGAKTRRWLTDWMTTSAPTAAGIYGLRCSLLHQGSPYPDDGSPRVAFSLGGPDVVDIHGPTTAITFDSTGETLRPISVRSLVEEVAAAVDSWIAAHGDTATVRRNLTRFAHYRDNVPPFFVGGHWIA